MSAVAIVTAVTLGVGVRLSSLGTGAPVLRIGRILVRGNVRLANGEVLAILAPLRGQSIITADLDAARTQLLQSPWVGDATLRRWLPSSIEVTIVERQPMAIGRLEHNLFLVDERGGVIDEYGPKYSEFDLPIVDGLTSAGSGTDPDPKRAALVAQLLRAVRAQPEVARRISQIDVTEARNAAVILQGDPALIRLGDERFLERLQSYLELAPALRARVPDLDYVDLRFDERVYVRSSSRRDDEPAREPVESSMVRTPKARF